VNAMYQTMLGELYQLSFACRDCSRTQQCDSCPALVGPICVAHVLLYVGPICVAHVLLYVGPICVTHVLLW